MDDDPERRRCALSRSATPPRFAISGRRSGLSTEINATESTNRLIWIALILCHPDRRDLCCALLQ